MIAVADILEKRLAFLGRLYNFLCSTINAGAWRCHRIAGRRDIYQFWTWQGGCIPEHETSTRALGDPRDSVFVIVVT